MEGYLILKKETLYGTTVVCKVAGSDTQWKEARKKGNYVPWPNGSKAASVWWWHCWKMRFAFPAKQQQQLIEGHNHSSAVDSAANLTNRHWNVRRVTLAKQTGLTTLKAQNMWPINAFWYMQESPQNYGPNSELQRPPRPACSPLLPKLGETLRPHKARECQSFA